MPRLSLPRSAPSCSVSRRSCVRSLGSPSVGSSNSTTGTLQRRRFHDYFVTVLPSSSLHPDSGSSSHKLPRSASTPHDPKSSNAPASLQHGVSPHGREMTTVRIPLKSAKHHYGVSNSRGTRPYNEDTYQAGTIRLPAFAKKGPMSLTGKRRQEEEEVAEGAASEVGDPQVFYFGVFDGHGGDTCSIWLREKLHTYLEDACRQFGVGSSLRPGNVLGDEPEKDSTTLSKELIEEWRETVGGYFRRFKPEHLAEAAGGKGQPLMLYDVKPHNRLDLVAGSSSPAELEMKDGSIEGALTYAFLRADLDFTIRQAQEANTQEEEQQEEEDDSFGRHSHHSQPPFLGGSTCSVALISTPTPAPFWSPSTPMSLLTAHIGDTRILLCSADTGAAIPVTQDHHPSAPVEADRLRKYSGMVTTDSFGEERISGLANTRSFGDARSKRLGVSAEPELKLMHIAASRQYSFLTLVSDGVTASLSDQEIVDTIKEARTPEQAARDVVSLATDLASGEKGNADNATALVVRLGGWERRAENGGGGMHTKEAREWRRAAANDPRQGRT